MKHVMIVLTLCMLVACGRSQQETSLAWKTDSLVRMSDSTLLIHNIVVGKYVFTSLEVVFFYLLLRSFNRV